MKKLLFILLLAVVCIGGYAQNAFIDPILVDEMGQRNNDEKIKVFVIMRPQYDRAMLNHRASQFITRAERREFVVNELKTFADDTQRDLRHSLAEMQRNGMTTEPNILWMANAMSFDATKAAIESLALRNDIEMIGFAIERNWIPDGEEASPATATREITQNVIQVGANQVWELGYTGEGVVVAVVDTGVNYNHLDLADHVWDGGSEFPHHGYDVYNNDNDPIDDHGHGTHCSGTVCGDGTAGSQTGMAPNATLMCVKCINANGNGGADMISAGLQWAVDHGCDMFSMSLGVANSSVAERTLLRNTCNAALDAGIVGAIAAGNEGDSQWQYPIPNNVRVPGSCPPPYMDPVQSENPGDLSCSICIGAVNYNDVAANFTSRGPVTWTNTEFGDYPYNPGIGLIRPDVCAPGVNIKSANYQNISGYTEMSGTSMATPCAAGCIALMLSKNIDLTPEEICRILEETAVPLAEGKSNTYGFGRINVLAAVEEIQASTFLALNSAFINDPLGNNDHKLNPGESVTVSLDLTNISDMLVSGANLTLTTNNEHVTITNGTAQVPNLSPQQSLLLEDIFAFSVDNEVLAKQKIKFTAEVYIDNELSGKLNFNVEVYDYQLQFGGVVVLNDDNGNALLDPGETAVLRVLVDNTGNELAQTVVGTLATDYAYATLIDTEKPFSTIGAGMMGYADYGIVLDAAAPTDFIIPFTLDLVDAYGRHTEMTFNYKNACNIIFSLHDSYGDGWQGNYLTVEYSDGTPTENLTVESGSSATYTRGVATGSTISLTWHNGSWTQECSFEVTYEDGMVIYQNEGGFSGTQTFEINCAGGGSAPEFCDPIQNLTYMLDGMDIILSWEAPASGTPAWYEIYRETELLDIVEELTYTDADVAEGFYNYCVYAAYDGCQSEYVCAEVEVSQCGAVQNLTHTMTSDLLCTLSWEAPEHTAGLIEYQIFMDEEQLGVTNELHYAFTIPTGEHDINVKAVFEGCEKDRFMHICILDEVQNLSYNLVGNTAIVWWDEIEGVEQYEITVNGQVGLPISDITYTFVVEDGLTTVKVEPVSEGCYTIENEIEICYSKPIENLHFVSMDEDTMLHFAWNASENVEYYEVTANGVVSQIAETAFAFPSEVGYNDFCVKSHSVYGCDSEPVCLSQNVCAAVDGFDYSFNGTEVVVTWNGDVASYEVVLDGAPIGMVDTNKFTGTLEGEHSLTITPVYEDCLALPAQFSFNITNTAPEIHFTDVHEGLMATAWTAVDGAIAYNLYRDGEMIAENLTATAYNDTAMAINAQHCYAVASVFDKGISDLSEAVCANYNTGVDELNRQVSVYPNPTTDKVTIECAGMSCIEVYNVEGKLIKRVEVDNDTYELKGLENGIYTLRILKGDAILVRRVVKL